MVRTKTSTVRQSALYVISKPSHGPPWIKMITQIFGAEGHITIWGGGGGERDRVVLQREL